MNAYDGRKTINFNLLSENKKQKLANVINYVLNKNIASILSFVLLE